MLKEALEASLINYKRLRINLKPIDSIRNNNDSDLILILILILIRSLISNKIDRIIA